MPARASVFARASALNCGLVRERGIERTSTSRCTATCLSKATNSAIVRVEWPIRKDCRHRPAHRTANARTRSRTLMEASRPENDQLVQEGRSSGPPHGSSEDDGWSRALEKCRLLFRAQGRAVAQML